MMNWHCLKINSVNAFVYIRNLLYSAKLKAFYNVWWFQRTRNEGKIMWIRWEEYCDLKVHVRPRIIHVWEGRFRAFSSRFILHFDSQESLLRPSIHTFIFITSKLPRLTSYHNYLASKMSDEFSKCSSSFKKEIAISQVDIRYSINKLVSCPQHPRTGSTGKVWTISIFWRAGSSYTG